VTNPRAHLLGGIAVTRAVFHSPRIWPVYAQMMLGGGTYQGTRVLSAATVAAMTRALSGIVGPARLGMDKKLQLFVQSE